MRIVSKQFIPHGAADTYTRQTWGQYLGVKPQYLTPVVQKRPDLSLLWLTKGLNNVFSNGKEFNGIKGATALDTFVYRWNIKSNLLPMIQIVETCTSNGVNQTPIILRVEKPYFHTNDTIRTKSGDTLLVKAEPIQVDGAKWEYTCYLVTNDSTDRITNMSALAAGEYVQWCSTYGYEADERGYNRFLYNFEEHQNYVSCHRVSQAWTGDFAMAEDMFVEMPKKDRNGKTVGQEYFRLPKIEQNLQEQMLHAINSNLLFGRTNMSLQSGRALHQAPNGMDIIMGDGLIAQVERVCDKQSYSRLSAKILRDAIATTSARSGKIIGNHLTFICNQRMWLEVQEVLRTEAKEFNVVANPFFVATDPTTKVSQKYQMNTEKLKQTWKVGATFTTYEYAGNFVTFMPDYSLTTDIQYKDRSYGIFINTDLTDNGEPNLQLVTIKGGELITGQLNGLGGQSGSASGVISTSVHGAELHWKAYSGLRVLDPYQAFILQSNNY